MNVLQFLPRIYGSKTNQKSIRTYLGFWKKSGNKAVQKKIQLLIEDIMKNPFEGIGKPEALKYNLQGTWSRKINE